MCLRWRGMEKGRLSWCWKLDFLHLDLQPSHFMLLLGNGRLAGLATTGGRQLTEVIGKWGEETSWMSSISWQHTTDFSSWDEWIWAKFTTKRERLSLSFSVGLRIERIIFFVNCPLGLASSLHIKQAESSQITYLLTTLGLSCHLNLNLLNWAIQSVLN